MRRSILAALVAALLIVSPVAATKDTITLDQPTPVFGDTVTFTIVSDQYYNWVDVVCVQDGVVVYAPDRSFTEATVPGQPVTSQPFTLSSAQWTGGAASCTADLLRLRYNRGHDIYYPRIATTSFEVLP